MFIEVQVSFMERLWTVRTPELPGKIGRKIQVLGEKHPNIARIIHPVLAKRK
jgi:hypothetical protein